MLTDVSSLWRRLGRRGTQWDGRRGKSTTTRGMWVAGRMHLFIIYHLSFIIIITIILIAIITLLGRQKPSPTQNHGAREQEAVRAHLHYNDWWQGEAHCGVRPRYDTKRCIFKYVYICTCILEWYFYDFMLIIVNAIYNL